MKKRVRPLDSWVDETPEQAAQGQGRGQEACQPRGGRLTLVTGGAMRHHPSQDHTGCREGAEGPCVPLSPVRGGGWRLWF